MEPNFDTFGKAFLLVFQVCQSYFKVYSVVGADNYNYIDRAQDLENAIAWLSTMMAMECNVLILLGI